MINGKWVMQDRKLSSIDEKGIRSECEDYAKKIDQFLIRREQSVLAKTDCHRRRHRGKRVLKSK